MNKLIDGVVVTPLKQISHPDGDIYHGLKRSDANFVQFGELYFSHIKQKAIKGWKCHRVMVSNLLVVVGRVRFVLYDGRENSSTFGAINEVIISPQGEYQRLTIPVDIWMAFQGLEDSIVVNLASIEHDANEADHLDLDNDKIPYSW